MSPTYHGNNIVIINKLDTSPNTGDVIAFHSDSLNTILIKRVVGLPNEKICIDNKLYNLGGDEYFVLGDNYTQSVDSRSSQVGFVKHKDIKGIIIPNLSTKNGSTSSSIKIAKQ